MSKKSTRIQVTLPPDVFEVVEEISSFGAISMSGLVAEIMTESKSGLVMILEALKKAKQQDKSGAIKILQDGLLDALSEGADLAKQMNQEK